MEKGRHGEDPYIGRCMENCAGFGWLLRLRGRRVRKIETLRRFNYGALSTSIDERTMVAAYAIHTISIMVYVMVPQGFLGQRIWKKADRPSWAVGPEFQLKK